MKSEVARALSASAVISTEYVRIKFGRKVLRVEAFVS